MPKFSIEYTITLTGSTEIEAATEDEARELADAELSNGHDLTDITSEELEIGDVYEIEEGE